MNLQLISLLLLVGTAVVAGACPEGGVWSEWFTTGACPTTCGGRSNATRTRICTNRCGDCPCTGPATDIGPCGLALCPFPSNGTCGAPYKKSLNYDTSTFFCGLTNQPAVVCGSCPEGGVWSEWVTGPCPTTCGGYNNVTRTRTCTKRCGDCPCSGPDTDNGPCGIAVCPSQFPSCKAPYLMSVNYDTRTLFCGLNNIPTVVCSP